MKVMRNIFCIVAISVLLSGVCWADIDELNKAIQNKDITEVQKQLAAGADINAHDSNGYTPLMIAASYGNVDIVELLIKKGAQIDARFRDYQETPLLMAAFQGYTDVVILLLDKGADIEARDYRDNTPFLKAMYGNHINTVRVLLDRGADIKANGSIAVMMAASCNYADLLRLLIERGAAVDIKANDPGAKTPLLESFNQMAPHLEIVRILVESGADVNAVDAFGNTPLTLASMKLGFLEASWQHAQKYKVRDTESAANADGYAQIVRYLVSKGAKVDVKNNKGQTAYDAINEYGVGVLEAISSDIIQLIKPEKSSF